MRRPATPQTPSLSAPTASALRRECQINTVAVFDVATPGKARSLGFIPVGWYPTSVRVSDDGKTLLGRQRQRRDLPAESARARSPAKRSTPGVHQYIGELLNGTVSVIPLPAGEKLERR